MAKKRGKARAKKQTTTPSPPPTSPGGNRRYLALLYVFVAAFVLAFLIAYKLFSPGTPPPAPPAAPVAAAPAARTLTRADIDEYAKLIDSGDFAAMRDKGGELFTKGTIIPDSKKVLEEYEINSYPPHTVYAFYTNIGGDASHRVLLTMDDEDRVEAFMAEEIMIAK